MPSPRNDLLRFQAVFPGKTRWAGGDGKNRPRRVQLILGPGGTFINDIDKLARLQDLLSGIKAKYAKTDKHYKQINAELTEQYRRLTQQYKDLQVKFRYFEVRNQYY